MEISTLLLFYKKFHHFLKNFRSVLGFSMVIIHFLQKLLKKKGLVPVPKVEFSTLFNPSLSKVDFV